MKTLVLVLSLFLGFTPPPHQELGVKQVNWVGIDSLVGPSVQRVEISGPDGEEEGSCSAGLVNSKGHYFLTAAHCVPEEEGYTLTVAKHPAVVEKVDYALDLAVLRVDGFVGKQLTLRAAVTPVGTPVAVVGYAFGAQRLKYTFGYICDQSEDLSLYAGLFTDAMAIPGHSGGMVVDINGQVVGVLQAGLVSHDGASLAILSTPQTLKAFVKEYLPKSRRWFW
jgi:S1-C subfamily serine protease